MDYNTTILHKRIWLTRYLMVIGIVVLHTPQYQPLSELTLAPFDFIKAFFSHALFRTTVPVLTVISAYLLFSSSLISKPLMLFKKKTSSILLPLIIWNIPIVLAIYLVQRYELLSHSFSVQLHPFSVIAWLDATTGIFSSPANYPLNFLRDLFVLAVLAPLLRPLLKHIPYIGLLFMIVVYFYDLDGDVVRRNSMILSFYTGALAATQKWDLTALDRFAWPLLWGLIAVCCAVVIWDIENREWLRLISPFLIWPCMSLLEDSRLSKLLLRHCQASFLTFLAHAPLLLLLWVIYQKFATVIPYPVFWFTAPLFIVIICAVCHKLLYGLFPRTGQLLLGGR